ncbi:MAG: polysaccharide biosynthesis tyrosine autokinase [Limisphaerales bacterium]
MAEMNKRKVDFTDVVFYLAVASKHARMMVLLVCMALVAGLSYYVYKRPVYRSVSTVKYVDWSPVGPDESDTKGQRFTDREVLKELMATHVSKRAQDELGFAPTQKNPVKPKLKSVSARFDSSEENIELDVHVFDPSWAERFPSNLVNAFMKVRADRRSNAMYQIRLTSERELEQLQKRISDAAGKRSEIDKEYDPERLRLQVAELSKISTELIEVQSNLRNYETVRARLHSSEPLSKIDRLMLYTSLPNFLKIGEQVPMGTVAPQPGANRTTGGRRGAPGDGGFQTLNSSQTSGSRWVTPDVAAAQSRSWVELDREQKLLEQQLVQAQKKYLDRHPIIRELRTKLQSVDQALTDAVYSADHAFRLNYDKLKGKEQQLKLREPEYRASLRRLQEYEERTRGQNLNVYWESELQKVINRRARDEKALEYDRVDLGQPHIFLLRKETPVSPPRFKLVIASFILGIALAIGIPFLLEFLDQTVTNMDKLEADTHMKGLGLVPDFEDTIAEAYPLIGSESMTDPDMLENFRVIRTNLVSAAATSKYPQVIMVTSTGPKEGKTVVSSNLALSFAQMGDKTLYIDTNLRRGLVHHLFSVRSSPGLSNVLVEKLDVNEAVRETAVENLSVLPTGDHLDGDIEMLGSTRLQQIMDELRNKYQRIILDAPPILGLSETASLQPVVDGVVMVIWSAFTSTRQIRTAMDILGDNHANFYGFVLNRLNLSATMNRFHYYYYSNHYYNRYQSMTVG